MRFECQQQWMAVRAVCRQVQRIPFRMQARCHACADTAERFFYTAPTVSNAGLSGR